MACVLALTACSTDNPTSFEPRLMATTVSDITRSEATLHGTISLKGATAMPEVCFRYGETEAMEMYTALQTPEGNDVSQIISSLAPGTTYYYALTATNGHTEVESQAATFSTLPNVLATITDLSILSYGPMSVIVSFDVQDNGGETITAAGCYVSESNGNTANSSAPAAGSILYEAENLANPSGTIRTRIGGLQQGKTYSIWPYVETKIGKVTGNAINFTTSEAVLLEHAGDLVSLVGDDLSGYKQITIAGEMNGNDLACLRSMLGIDADGAPTNGTLSDIDLTDAVIVEGGESYDGQRFTQSGVIGQGLFANCSQLKNIVLPSSVTAIEKDAFKGCTSLQHITIPASVRSILPSSGCTALQGINVSAANTAYQSNDGVLLNKDATEILWFPMGKTGDYTLPSTITEIGDYAFQECSITRFTLPDNLKTIGQAAFYNSRVEEVTLPASLKQVPSATFQKCGNLKTVTLGEGTELLGDHVFDGCPIEALYVHATIPPVCTTQTFTNNAYPDWTSTCTLYVPKGRKPYYSQHKRWSVFASYHIKEMDAGK